MPVTRNAYREEIYDQVRDNVPAATPDPETDINVKRGLTWAIGGTMAGALVAVAWFGYRMFSPIEGVHEAEGAVAEYILVPVLAALYATIGAVIGGCLGMGVGIVFMAIAAAQTSEDAEDEEEADPLPRPSARRVGQQY